MLLHSIIYISFIIFSLYIYTSITIAIIAGEYFSRQFSTKTYFLVECVQLPARGIGSVGHYKAQSPDRMQICSQMQCDSSH